MVQRSHTAGWWPGAYEPLRKAGERGDDWIAPSSEAAASAQAYEISMELPGVAAADIDIALHEDVLTVKGEKRAEREQSGKTWFFSEREYGAFQRSFRLPPDADPDGVSATCTNGVLKICIARREAQPEGVRKVQVSSH